MMYVMYRTQEQFHGPAHLGGAAEELYLVLIRGDEEELLRGAGRVPSHTRRHCALLHTLSAQNEKLVHVAVFQVVLHLLQDKCEKYRAF